MTGIESCRKGDKRMKQAEHPPVTAGANSAAEYSLALIDQLARIDRTCSKKEMDELVYRLLAFVGGHLGSARENLRMLTLLEEKQKSLEQNLQAVKLEQQMLKVLCKDSTSVYRVDLMNDRAEIVKIEEHSNSAGDLLPHGQELFSYAEAVEHYYHKCVLKESAPDFLQPVALLHHLEHAEAVEAGHVDVEQQQVDVELGVQQIERLHAVVGIEVFVADAEDFGKDLLVHFRIVRDQDFGFDHSVDLIRILGRALL